MIDQQNVAIDRIEQALESLFDWANVDDLEWIQRCKEEMRGHIKTIRNGINNASGRVTNS